MQIDALRRIDRYAGIPLCWASSLMRRLYLAIRGERLAPKPQKVLIIKLSEMGSTVLAYPALAELKRRGPDVQLYFLVFRKNAAIMEVLKLAAAENIITVDYRTPWALLSSGLRAMLRLFRERFDTAIDMDLFSRLTALISFFVCRGNRVGFHRYNDEGLYRGDLLTHRAIYSPHIHTSAAFTAMVRSLFEKANDEPYYRGSVDSGDLELPVYQPEAIEMESVRQKLVSAGIKPEHDTILLINPNSSDIFPLRKWPLNYYAQLCRRLLAKLPESVLVITGVSSEREGAKDLLEQVDCSRCSDFTGKTSFRELLALYSIAAVMVTNDSGPAHFASLLRLPTVVLFGPETPRLYSPIGGKHKDMYANFACSPCVSVYNGKKSPCRENRCLMAITPESVFEEMLVLLDGVPGMPPRLVPNRFDLNAAEANTPKDGNAHPKHGGHSPERSL
jgi:ADP-heptose:LPS heptosyltransferase